MGLYPRFGSWINPDSEEPHEEEESNESADDESENEESENDESTDNESDDDESANDESENDESENVESENDESENDESKQMSHKDTNNAHAKKKKKRQYYDDEEDDTQHVLWVDAEKKHPWYDAPLKMKVTMNKGLCHVNIEMIVGGSPTLVYSNLTDLTSTVYYIGMRKLMVNKVVKILKDDGPRQLMKVKKDVSWKFLWWDLHIPMTLIVDENHTNRTVTYKKDKVMFMKVFKGDYKVEPIYVDAKRFCKHVVPKSPEEYRKCSGGRGRLASKFTMNQYFQPYPPFNLPPISWYIRYITVKTTKTLVECVQEFGGLLRDFSVHERG